MADVFVSYARNDKARVAPIVAAIEAQGWSVWWDPAIGPGQEFDRQIAAELRAAAAVLVVWTPTSVQSRWVRGEARDGADRAILVPVRFAGADLPIDVRALHTVDLDDWADDPGDPRAQEVLRALGAVIARGRSTASSAVVQESTAAPGVTANTAAICVLPFANMSGDPEQEYFSDGITEDIITDLSKISALAVSSRNSAFVYKGRHVDVKKVARELGVRHVLEGSVRKAGSRVRITAQLVDAVTDSHVWAERYDRDLHDIFALQDEISQAIVKALQLRLLPEERVALGQRGTDNVEAYNLYLMAWQRYISGPEHDAAKLDAIVRLCLGATGIDPGYARAWALMALAQMMLRFTHGRDGDDGLEAAERALTLEPGLAEAYSAKARILARRGRFDESFAQFDMALRLDPDSWDVNRWIAYWRLKQGRRVEAIRHYEKAMSLLDTDLLSPSMLQSCYTSLGDTRNVTRVARIALQRAEKALARDPANVQALMYGGTALASLGEGERARQWLNRGLTADPGSFLTRYNFVCALIDLGETDAALERLGQLFETVDASMLQFIQIDPDLDSLQDEPRFKALVTAAAARLANADPGRDQ